jgi:hypothetical protein
MNLLFRTLLALCLVTSAAGQGTLNFANRIAGGVLDAPITTPGGLTGFGTLPNAMVQLFLVSGSSLTPVGTAIGFRATSGPLAKYFEGGPISVPSVSVGGSGTFRVRVWTGTEFNTGGVKGESANFIVSGLGGDPGNGNPPAVPADMLNMKGFVVFPEPATIGAMILGFGIIALRTKRIAAAR